MVPKAGKLASGVGRLKLQFFKDDGPFYPLWTLEVGEGLGLPRAVFPKETARRKKWRGPLLCKSSHCSSILMHLRNDGQGSAGTKTFQRGPLKSKCIDFDKARGSWGVMAR